MDLVIATQASINNMPPEILTMVLSDKGLTLRQRIALRVVSSHWQEIIEKHLKLSTKLLLSDSELVDPVDESNRLPFKAELMPLVIRLFPILADLEVRINREVYQPLPRLLTAFSSTLTTLELRRSSESNINDQQWITDLATAINSLTALTTLGLMFLPRTLFPQLLLATFSRLQKFRVINRSQQLVEPWSSITANQPLASMTSLTMNGTTRSNYTAFVRDIVASFPSLQSLHLWLHSNGPSNIIDMFRSLSTLEHLSELSLGCLSCSTRQLNPLPSPADQPLTSVKKLDLYFSKFITSKLLSSLLVGWFPSIEECTLSCAKKIQLTTTTLRNLVRLQQLKELVLKEDCLLKVQLRIAPTDRPLTSLKELSVIIATEQFGSSVFVGWFPCLVDLSLKFKSNLPLTTAILRDFSRLENLSNLELIGMQFEADQLHLPTSNDRRLVNVKKLGFAICQEPEDEGRYLCTALAAWFPGLKQLSIPDEMEGKEIFMPSFSVLSEFATLEYLTDLRFSINIAKFTKDHFPLPTSTDQVLFNLKELYFEIFDWPIPDRNFAGCDERHLISALASWFPNLEKLTIVLALYVYPFNLTSDLLRELPRLEHLCELKLPRMRYEKKHLQAPSSTDCPLTCLKALSLDMAEQPQNFDAQYFCSTIAAWFPRLEKIHIGPDYVAQNERDHLIAYQTAIEANRHHFGRLFQLRTALSR